MRPLWLACGLLPLHRPESLESYCVATPHTTIDERSASLFHAGPGKKKLCMFCSRWRLDGWSKMLMCVCGYGFVEMFLDLFFGVGCTSSTPFVSQAFCYRTQLAINNGTHRSSRNLTYWTVTLTTGSRNS
jgi:hypothetical protein